MISKREKNIYFAFFSEYCQFLKITHVGTRDVSDKLTHNFVESIKKYVKELSQKMILFGQKFDHCKSR